MIVSLTEIKDNPENSFNYIKRQKSAHGVMRRQFIMLQNADSKIIIALQTQFRYQFTHIKIFYML